MKKTTVLFAVSSNNKDYFKRLTDYYHLSRSACIDWFIENILAGKYGENVVDDIIEHATFKKYRV